MVDRQLVERILSDIRMNVDELEKASDITWEKCQIDVRSRRFVERSLHILIEACFDGAQHIISDQKYREPETYRDLFTILAENSILEQEDLKNLHNMASFRNKLVHPYEKIDDGLVFGFFKKNLSDFKVFSKRIADFLNQDRNI